MTVEDLVSKLTTFNPNCNVRIGAARDLSVILVGTEVVLVPLSVDEQRDFLRSQENKLKWLHAKAKAKEAKTPRLVSVRPGEEE